MTMKEFVRENEKDIRSRNGTGESRRVRMSYQDHQVLPYLGEKEMEWLSGSDFIDLYKTLRQSGYKANTIAGTQTYLRNLLKVYRERSGRNIDMAPAKEYLLEMLRNA